MVPVVAQLAQPAQAEVAALGAVVAAAAAVALRVPAPRPSRIPKDSEPAMAKSSLLGQERAALPLPVSQS